MRILKAVIAAALILPASADVQTSSDHPEDAQLVSDMIENYLSNTSLVSMNEEEGSLVLFVSMGGDWTDSEDNWMELILICSYAVSLDLEREWELKDIAVSFSDSWCRIAVEDLIPLDHQDISQEELIREIKNLTEVYSLDTGD